MNEGASAYPRGGKCIMGDNDHYFRFIKSLDLIRGKISKNNGKIYFRDFFHLNGPEIAVFGLCLHSGWL